MRHKQESSESGSLWELAFANQIGLLYNFSGIETRVLTQKLEVMLSSTSSASLSTKFIQEISETLPHAPVISSASANWDNILLVHHRQPAFSTPEHCLPYHQICIKLGKPYFLKQVIDGHAETLQAVPGEIGLYLANLSQSFCWDREAEFLQLYLSPELFRQISKETWGNERIEFIFQPSALIDPLIVQIGLALKTTLETEGSDGRLYADSMTMEAQMRQVYTNIQKVLSQHSASIDHIVDEIVFVTDMDAFISVAGQ